MAQVTNLPLFTSPAPAADYLALDNQIIQSINNNLSGLTNGTVSHVVYPDAQLTAISAAVNGSQSIQYIPIKEAASFTQAALLASISGGTTANASTFIMTISQMMGLYSNNAGTLSSIATGSATQSLSYASNSTASFNGVFQLTCPLSAYVPAGDYFMLANISTSQVSSSGGATGASTNATLTMYGGGQIGSANAFVPWGSTVASTGGFYSGMGMHTSTSNALPATIPLGSVNNTGTNIQIANLAIQLRAV